MFKTAFAIIVVTICVVVLIHMIMSIVYVLFGRKAPLAPPLADAGPPGPATPEPKELKTCKRYNVYALPPPKQIPSDEELGIVRPQLGTYIAKPCAHRDEPRAFSYEVYGINVRVPHVTRCPDCMQELLEHLFERCAECGLGIPGGCKVGISWIGAPHPYTHLDCAESPLLFCGIWEYGRLLTLNQISNQFNPNVATVQEDSEIDMAREANASQTEEPDGDAEETNPSGASKPGTN